MADKPETLPEPDAYRMRHRSENGMIGHYPWAYADQSWGRRKYTQPTYEYEDLYTASTLREAIKGARLKAIQAAYDAMFDAKGCKACRFDAQTAIRKLMEDEQ